MAEAPVDLTAIMRRQATERYRAVLVTGPAGCGKTAYARKLAKLTQAVYLDLLAAFLAEAQLAAAVETFGCTELLALVKGKGSADKPLILDAPDFLLNTWSTGARRDFYDWLARLDDRRCPFVVCVFAQDDDALAGTFGPNSAGDRRHFEFGELQAL